ncbi:MAG: hypothetical protein V7746_24865 [Halioglobus sp.]
MTTMKQQRVSKQRGVALAIVVWFLAAMSLLVSGIVFQARVDTKMAQVHVARAKAQAAGDGAIQLMLSALSSGNLRGNALPRGTFEIGGLPVTVELVRVSGLVDLNRADAGTLGLLFASSQQSSGEAQLIADNVVKWRNSSHDADGLKKPVKFASIEDVMRVEGVGRTQLDAIRDYVVVGQAGQLEVSLVDAPAPLLKLLAGKNGRAAASVLDGRAGLAASDKKIQSSRGAKYRVDARVQVGEQTLLRRRWVDMVAGKNSELPWRFSRIEPVRVTGDS